MAKPYKLLRDGMAPEARGKGAEKSRQMLAETPLQELRADGNFIPCPVDDGDELFPNGIFEFNITKMLEYIQQNPDDITLEEVAVTDLSERISSINESHTDSVEISRPVILAEISPGRYNLIDGNHRLEKARRTGTKSLKAYKLNSRQHIRFLTSQKTYAAYIEYWNSKLK
jgi:ParB/Sulfiredoxin domain